MGRTRRVADTGWSRPSDTPGRAASNRQPARARASSARTTHVGEARARPQKYVFTINRFDARSAPARVSMSVVSEGVDKQPIRMINIRPRRWIARYH